MSTGLRPRAWPAPQAADFILQRSGERPLRFSGAAIACSDGAAPPAWARLRLAIYVRADGGYVSELLCLPVRPGPAGGSAPAWCHAAQADSLTAALEHFENAAAQPDDAVPADAPDEAAAALFEAAGRLCRVTAQERALRHAVGEFMYRFYIDTISIH